MRIYLDQPQEEDKSAGLRKMGLRMKMSKMERIIQEVIEEDLPDCAINSWFLKSVYSANMVDRIMDKIWGNV